MNVLSLRLIRAAFLFLALGIGIGVAFAAQRAWGARWYPLHAEFNLWGWATLLVYGMAYHMLPRFVGQPLRWPRLATLQSWLALGGVSTAALGWLIAPHEGSLWLRGMGGLLQFGAALLFASLMMPLLSPQRATHV